MREAGWPMANALAQARLAGQRGEVPVGAVLVSPDGSVLAEAGNACEARLDPSAHAEMLVLRAGAAALGGRVEGCDLWVTLEPCAMCAAAAALFRVKKVVFGAYDPKGGGVEHGARIFEAAGCLHRPEVVGGMRAAESAKLLRGFFQALRES